MRFFSKMLDQLRKVRKVRKTFLKNKNFNDIKHLRNIVQVNYLRKTCVKPGVFWANLRKTLDTITNRHKKCTH